MLDSFDHMECVNLDKRKDRWDLVTKEFKYMRLDVDRFPAIHLPDHGAVGNHLSHAFVLLRAKQANLDNVLIFEDDVEFFPDAPESLRKAMLELPDDWDMFYLGINMDEFHADRVSEHIAKLTGGFSTHAYAVRHTLFDTLISLNCNPTTLHNDVSYSREVIPFHNCYVSIPLIAGQRDGYSDIQKLNVSYNTMMLERFRDKLR